MGRDKSAAQPHRKLSEEEWDQLLLDYENRKEISVEALCRAKGVTKQRFYCKFPGGRRPEAKLESVPE